MLVVSFLIIILLTTAKNTEGFITDENEDVNNIRGCAISIINKYFIEKTITMVNVKTTYDVDEIIKAVNNMLHASIVLKDTSVKSKVQNVQYFITAASAKEFIREFAGLISETTWNPEGKFLIVIKLLKKDNLFEIFNTLLDAHVVNSLVLNGSKSVDIYAYNPFENYACGKSFERIISYGKCKFSSKLNLYPNKLVTGLRNCTFKALVAQFPPLIIDPRGNKNALVGMEQFAFNTVSELEGFKVEYIFGDFGETMSTVDENNTAHGVLARIQSRDVDAVFGFMMLTAARGAAFDYLFGHLAFTDEFSYFVQKAGPIGAWKNLYLEFTMTVWLLVLGSFVTYAIFMVMLIRGQDRVSIVVKMVDVLFLHGPTIRYRFMVKVVFLAWVWFAYLINSIYQSSLFSLTTHPINDYQVKDVEDLRAYNYKPCVSSVVNKFMTFEAQVSFEQHEECEHIDQASLFVSRNERVYTILPQSCYLYYKYLYFDATGKSKLTYFDEAINKIIYTIYLYKGFPMYHRMHSNTLRLRENGLMNYYFVKLYHEQNKKYPDLQGSNGEKVYHVIVPWIVLVIGVVVSTITFVCEILSKKSILKQLKRK